MTITERCFAHRHAAHDIIETRRLLLAAELTAIVTNEPQIVELSCGTVVGYSWPNDGNSWLPEATVLARDDERASW